MEGCRVRRCLASLVSWVIPKDSDPRLRLHRRPASAASPAGRGREDQVLKEASRMPVRHRERHRAEHTGWLRAAVLGANDGILSTASLVLGVAAAHGTCSNVLGCGG